MKRCLACQAEFTAQDWHCPACGCAPALRDGVLTFAPELALAGGSYASEFFAELAVREDANFWFRARNRLIARAMQRWFPTARRMLELGCGTGFVLRGLQQALPQLELTGSELFSAGPAIAR